MHVLCGTIGLQSVEKLRVRFSSTIAIRSLYDSFCEIQIQIKVERMLGVAYVQDLDQGQWHWQAAATGAKWVGSPIDFNVQDEHLSYHRYVQDPINAMHS